MTAKDNLEEKLEGLADAIGTDGSIVENVMCRIDQSGEVRKSDNNLLFRRFIMNRFTKFAAAAMIIIAVVLSVTVFDTLVPKVYGMTDLPELFEKAGAIHIKWRVYFPRHTMPDGREIPPAEMENWFDLVNGRVRFTGTGLSAGPNEVRITLGETVSDGEYKMCLNHTDKSAVFFKISNYQRMLETRYGLNNMFTDMVGGVDELHNFAKTGQEEIDGVEYDIWEVEIEGAERHKYWLSPGTGESGRVQGWMKLDNGQWRLKYEYYKIDREANIPEGIFTTEAPQGYTLKNTKETAKALELGDAGSVHYSSLTLDPRTSFTLSDGSVIVGWHSADSESTTPQQELFEGLQFGGALPKLPVEVYGLKPRGWSSDITYVGQHLAYTQKGDKFIEWGLYVPDGPAPKRSEMDDYEVLCRFNLEYEPKWRIAYTLDYGILIETPGDFDKWVLGAMAELSDDGRAPDNVTYESVLQLAEQIRASQRQ